MIDRKGGDSGMERAGQNRGWMKAWFDTRGRHEGAFAFALNRLTGLGLTLYLVIHLIVLSLLLGGDSGWDKFLDVVRSPLFLALDVVLFFGVIFHGLNGIRLSLVGLGIAVKVQKTLLRALMVVGALAVLGAAWLIFTA